MTDRTVSSLPRLILGSTSPWRRDMLASTGLPFETAAPRTDEAAIFETLRDEGYPAQIIANEIVLDKAETLLSDFEGQDILLIVGDQLADFEGEARGKPRDAAQARAWLRGYRGTDVTMVSALAVGDPRKGVVLSGAEFADLAFGDLPDEAIEEAIRSGEVLRSCGAVVHEQPSIAPYARILRGTADTVAGLPLTTLIGLLKSFGYRFDA